VTRSAATSARRPFASLLKGPFLVGDQTTGESEAGISRVIGLKDAIESIGCPGLVEGVSKRAQRDRGDELG